MPDGIGQLVHLQRLCLSHNAIAALPACIGQLTNLQHLDLRNNSLKELPQVRDPSHMCCYDSFCVLLRLEPHSCLLAKGTARVCILSWHDQGVTTTVGAGL